MKTVTVSEATFNSIKENLISKLSFALTKREERIKSNDIVGLNASPEAVVNFYVITAFQELERA